MWICYNNKSYAVRKRGEMKLETKETEKTYQTKDFYYDLP